MPSYSLPLSTAYDKTYKPVMGSRRFISRSYILAVTFLFAIIFYLNSKSSTNITPLDSTSVKSAKPRIAIVTLTTKQTSYTYQALSNKWEYAREHNYDLIVDYKSLAPKGPVWHKLIMIEEASKTNKYDWIWWVDFDTLITNMTIKVEDIIGQYATDKTDMILTADCFPLNAGSMLLRTTPRLQGYMDQIRDCGSKKEAYSEQDCLRDQIQDEEYVKKGIVVMAPQWRLNAFPNEISCFDDHRRGWERGMFLVHFAGAWAHVKGEDPTGSLMTKYGQQIIYP